MLVEEQRKNTWMFVPNELPALASHSRICSESNCRHAGEEHCFPGPLALVIKESEPHFFAMTEAPWPPLTLRTILEKTGSAGDIAVFSTIGNGHYVRGDGLKYLCTEASQTASELCIECLRDSPIVAGRCEQHGKLRKYCVDSDPLFSESAVRY